MPNLTRNSFEPQGWTPSPDGRGTIDIIWSCTVTISLCTWSVLCVNVAAPGDGFLRKVSRKAGLAGMCMLFPDLLVWLAIGQWESACRSVEEFRRLGDFEQSREKNRTNPWRFWSELFGDGELGWSMKHAFFADMGGFVVSTSDGASWPLDTRQLHYLIAEGFIVESVVSTEIMLKKDVIDDKNKKDAFFRIITLAQILYFVANCIGRACQKLTTTTLELTTLGFITTTIAVVFFWRHKPSDISVPFTLNIEFSVADIQANAGAATPAPSYDTPLDFLNPEHNYLFACWSYNVSILQKIGILSTRKTQFIRGRREDNFPPVSFRYNCLAIFVGAISFSMNFVAWNFWFPSSIERNLWRAFSLAWCGLSAIGIVHQEILCRLFPTLKQHACRQFASRENALGSHTPNKPGRTTKLPIIKTCKSALVRMRNISPNKDPAMTMPLRMLIPMLFCGALYSIARLYILIEDLIAFRALPADAYQTVNWSQIFPHV